VCLAIMEGGAKRKNKYADWVHDEEKILKKHKFEPVRGSGWWSKTKKKAKKAAKSTEKAVVDTSKDVASGVSSAADKTFSSMAKGVTTVFDEAQKVGDLLTKGSQAISNAANKSNIQALAAKGATFVKFLAARSADVEAQMGKTVQIAFNGLATSGKLVATVGTICIVVGAATGQPELVVVGMVLTEDGTMMELAGSLGPESITLTRDMIKGDWSSAGKAAIDLMTTAGGAWCNAELENVNGACPALIDCVKDLAAGKGDAALKDGATAALQLAGVVAGSQTTGSASVATEAVTSQAASTAVDATAKQVQGSGPANSHRLMQMDPAENLTLVQDSDIRQAAGQIAMNREVRENPTNIAAPWVEPKSAKVKRLGAPKSWFKRAPTVRGFGANYVRGGYREGETPQSSVGTVRFTSRSVTALPKPNYRATGFDGSFDTIYENSRHVPEINVDQRITDLSVPVPVQVRQRVHVRGPM